MAVPVANLPPEVLRSKRWGVRVGDNRFALLHLEQALLLAVVVQAGQGVFFELGREGEVYWGTLRLPQNTPPQVRLALRELLGPSALSFMEGNRDWFVLFRSPHPLNHPPFLSTEGEVVFPERAMGREVVLLDRDKTEAIREHLAKIGA